eukprot:scaffold30535_cov38-Cyclotella_meneghiniana.AAC.3
MSTYEDKASETSHAHDELIELLDRNEPKGKRLTIKFYLDDVDVDPSDAAVEITLRDAKYSDIARFTYTLGDPAEWERLGSAIARCCSLYDVEMMKEEGGIDQIGALNRDVYQCIETLYKGLELNTSIESFVLNMDLFPSSGVFPIFNLNGALFKENLNVLWLESDIPIGRSQTLMILPLLESTSLEFFNISMCIFENEAASFRSIISACTTVQKLEVSCVNTIECDTMVANLLRNQRSCLTKISLYKPIRLHEDNLSIIEIIDVLNRNTRLKTLHLGGRLRLDMSQVANLMCDALSIEGIHNSNHTLEVLMLECMDVAPFVRECLELNKDTNKDKVIRTKIARYYFRGDFDLSPFINMNVKLLPNVMAMIEGDHVSRRDAIYRLLRSIPDLFTYPSGLSRKRKPS